jgi:dolichyl-diphosphooligosaccharide--protein glycosyltransferase/undecaprenyl-diphosphooligosaccharide--protein glycosyltransferase
MNKIQELLNIEEKKFSIPTFILLMLIAFAFSFAVRLIWVTQFQDIPDYSWNNEIMLNTNDGYFFAEGARDIISGHHQDNDLSPIEFPLAKLTAFLSMVLPISFETLILYMPAFFGSLLIIPVILVGRLLKLDHVGFVAAMITGIVWSYYNRTMVGYYDTDLLIVVFPTFVMYGLLLSIYSQDSKTLSIAPLFAALAIMWHGGILNVVHASLAITFFYTIIFDRKNLFNYKLLILLSIALLTIPLSIKLFLIIVFASVFHFFNEKIPQKMLVSLIVTAVLNYFFFGGFTWIMNILSNAYILRGADLTYDLHFFAVVNTVREAGHIPFETFANRISGSEVLFILSVIGYALFTVRYKILLLTLPMVGLGFFAMQGGLRFTVFAVPFMALGFSFFAVLISQYLSLFAANKIQKPLQYLLISVFTVFSLYPNIQHIIAYKVPTVFNKTEVEILDRLGKIASSEDYVISWWDYGYPIRYYADVKTIVDGGKHDGNVNFPVSFALTNNQVAAANMMRMDVEYTEFAYQNNIQKSSIKQMLEATNGLHPNQFLGLLNQKDLNITDKTRDIFLYLPGRMLNILPTVKIFSNMDLTTGQQYNSPLFYRSTMIQDNGKQINLGNNIIMDKQTGTIKIQGQNIRLNSMYITQYDGSGKLQVQKQSIDPTSRFFIVYMRNHNSMLLMDSDMFNSTFIQLYALENYDPELYEPVELNPYAKVYKLLK